MDFCLDQADIHRVTDASRVKFLAWPGAIAGNDFSALDSRSKIARRALDCSEAASLALDIHAAARSNLGEPRLINIVEPQLKPCDAQFGNEIETADPRPDDRNRLNGALVSSGRSPCVERPSSFA